jgi:hypothetical protein
VPPPATLPATPAASVLRRGTDTKVGLRDSWLLTRPSPVHCCCCCCWAVGEPNTLPRGLPRTLEGLLPSRGFTESWMNSVCCDGGDEGLWPSGSSCCCCPVLVEPARFQNAHLQTTHVLQFKPCLQLMYY